VPFRIYRIDITDRARRQNDLIGLDAVSGALDLYRFERPLQDDELVRVQTPNHLAPLLPDNAAREIVTTRVERLTFQRTGFFAVSQLHVAVEPIAESQMPYWPYWVGFFGSGEAARVVAMDAVRRTIEGDKVVRLLRRWLNGVSEL